MLTAETIRKEFNGRRLEHCRVSSTCLVHFARNRSSVLCAAAGKILQVKACAGRLKDVDGGKLIAEHTQKFGRDKTVYDFWHYVPLLDRTPGALRNDVLDMLKEMGLGGAHSAYGELLE
jgi:hypothetical protein